MSKYRKWLGLFAIVFAFAFSGVEARAQQGKIPRVGYISMNFASSPGPLVEAFQQGLRDLGYVNGKNIVIEYRYGEGKENRISGLVKELVHSNVDVLVVPTGVGARIAKQATKTIPIVMIVQADPVAVGLGEPRAAGCKSNRAGKTPTAAKRQAAGAPQRSDPAAGARRSASRCRE